MQKASVSIVIFIHLLTWNCVNSAWFLWNFVSVAFAVIFQHVHLESDHQHRFPFSAFHLKMVTDPFSEILLVFFKDWNCVQCPKYRSYPFTLLLLYCLFLVPYYMFHMGQQFIITHTIFKTEILHYQTLGLKIHILSKYCVHKKISTPYIYIKT